MPSESSAHSLVRFRPPVSHLVLFLSPRTYAGSSGLRLRPAVTAKLLLEPHSVSKQQTVRPHGRAWEAGDRRRGSSGDAGRRLQAEPVPASYPQSSQPWSALCSVADCWNRRGGQASQWGHTQHMKRRRCLTPQPLWSLGLVCETPAASQASPDAMLWGSSGRCGRAGCIGAPGWDASGPPVTRRPGVASLPAAGPACHQLPEAGDTNVPGSSVLIRSWECPVWPWLGGCRARGLIPEAGHWTGLSPAGAGTVCARPPPAGGASADSLWTCNAGRSSLCPARLLADTP